MRTTAMEPPPPAPDEYDFDWGDERTLEQKVQDGDVVVVSFFDLWFCFATGLVGPTSVIVALSQTHWAAWLGLLIAGVLSLVVAIQHATRARLIAQLKRLSVQAGTMRFKDEDDES